MRKKKEHLPKSVNGDLRKEEEREEERELAPQATPRVFWLTFFFLLLSLLLLERFEEVGLSLLLKLRFDLWPPDEFAERDKSELIFLEKVCRGRFIQTVSFK